MLQSGPGGGTIKFGRVFVTTPIAMSFVVWAGPNTRFNCMHRHERIELSGIIANAHDLRFGLGLIGIFAALALYTVLIQWFLDWRSGSGGLWEYFAVVVAICVTLYVLETARSRPSVNSLLALIAFGARSHCAAAGRRLRIQRNDLGRARLRLCIGPARLGRHPVTPAVSTHRCAAVSAIIRGLVPGLRVPTKAESDLERHVLSGRGRSFVARNYPRTLAT